eukprot:8703833-Pyramimonas_sp.AAC.1
MKGERYSQSPTSTPSRCTLSPGWYTSSSWTRSRLRRRGLRQTITASSKSAHYLPLTVMGFGSTMQRSSRSARPFTR